MASTKPFQHADDNFSGGSDDAPGESRAKRGAFADGESISGWPDPEGLKPVLAFLVLPAILVLAITLTGGNWPSSILYPIALVLGLVVAISALKGVELVLACLIIYLPFSKVFVVPLAPGVNGTNMLILLGLFAAMLRASAVKQKWDNWPPGTALVVVFGILTSLSAITITFLPGGRTYFIYNEILSYKAWIDQFIFYFILLICIRDVESAKRCVVYMLIGSVLVVLYSVPEMLEKMGRSTIEKSRIQGPLLQSNNFGGFVAYTLLPLLAIFLVYIKDLRAWLLTPYFLLTAKVLISTFSRGAYLAIVIGGFMAGWYKGRGFLALWVSILLSLVLVFPSLIPDSIVARMGSLSSNDVSSSAPEEEKLDKSSSTRLIMWRAGAQMILEDPVWGKGFKGFPYLKEDYTEVPVKESDPHSMYLYIGSQMGLPSLALFVLILGYSFNLGRLHAGNEQDRFIKAIGIGGASATACYAVVCIFGSRAVALNFTAYFWTMLVVMQVLKQKSAEAEAALRPRRTRTNAFATSAAGSRGDRRQKGVVPDTNNEAEDSRQQQGKKRPGRTGLRGAAAYQAAVAAGSADAEVSSAPADMAGDPAGSSKRAARRRPWKRPQG